MEHTPPTVEKKDARGEKLRPALAAVMFAISSLFSPARADERQISESEITKHFEMRGGAEKKFWEDMLSIKEQLKPYSEVMTCSPSEDSQEDLELDPELLPYAKEIEEIVRESRDGLEKFSWQDKERGAPPAPSADDMVWAQDMASAIEQGLVNFPEDQREKIKAYLAKKFGCNIS